MVANTFFNKTHDTASKVAESTRASNLEEGIRIAANDVTKVSDSLSKLRKLRSDENVEASYELLSNSVKKIQEVKNGPQANAPIDSNNNVQTNDVENEPSSPGFSKS